MIISTGLAARSGTGIDNADAVLRTATVATLAPSARPTEVGVMTPKMRGVPSTGYGPSAD
jgi:hypothetical protein